MHLGRYLQSLSRLSLLEGYVYFCLFLICVCVYTSIHICFYISRRTYLYDCTQINLTLIFFEELDYHKTINFCIHHDGKPINRYFII